jgi:hypothetical protein
VLETNIPGPYKPPPQPESGGSTAIPPPNGPPKFIATGVGFNHSGTSGHSAVTVPLEILRNR